MRSSLLHRVHNVQVAARRLILLCGVAWFAATAIVSLIGLGLIDYSLRLHHPIGRWLVCLSLLALVAASFLRLVVPVLRSKQSTVATARRIERRFPELRERLSSAIAFLGEAADDPTAGSDELRRAVIAEAEASAANRDFRTVLDRRAMRRAFAASGTAFLVAFTIAVIDPATTGLALARMVAPWRKLPWPRKHELLFVDAPSRVAKGEDCEVLLVDRRGALPDDLEVQIRQRASSGTTLETRHIQALGGKAVFRLENVTSDFEYRARGGDDDTMPWLEVALVEPPKVLELQVVVRPPAYTGLAKRSEGQIVTALIGSTLEMRAKIDQPIQRASLISVSSDMGSIPLDVASGGRTVSAGASSGAWTVEQSGTFELELTDYQGMTFGHSMRIELHAVTDRPPSITWNAPAEHVFVTAVAAVPIRATVEDDLAVHRVQFRYLHSRKSDEEAVVELYRGPDVLGQGERAGSIPPVGTREAEVHHIRSTFDLSASGSLEPGDALAIRLTAEDYKQQLTTTSVRRVTVITKEEFENRIAARQSAVLAQLGEALQLARQCREQTGALEERIGKMGLPAAELSALEAARYSLRQVQRLVGGGSEGAAGQIGALLDELTANRMEQASASQRLRGLLKQVQSLQDRSLPAIDQALTEALKLIREADPESDSVIDSSGCSSPREGEIVEQLRKAGEREEQVIQELEQMTGALAQWDSVARIAGEIGQIRLDQSRLAEETDELKLRSIAGGGDRGSDRAGGRQMSQRQLDLARRLDKLQTRMEELIARAASGNARSAPALAGGLEAARRLAIGGRMREAAALLGQFQLDQARQIEQQALDALNGLERALAMQRDGESDRELHTRLQQIAAALGLDPALARDQGRAAGEGRQQSAEPNKGPSPAEIKLVRLLQETINERTAALEAIRVEKGELTAQRQQELEALAREQGRLAEMVLEWIKADAK